MPSRFSSLLALSVAIAAITPELASGQASQNARVKALVGGTLIDGYGGAPLRNSVIIIEGERIRAVADGHDRATAPSRSTPPWA